MRSLMMEPGHTVDQDAVAPHLVGQRLGERHHAHAGDAGEHQVGDGLVDGAGQDVDDAAGALALEMRQGLAAHPPEEEERALHRGLPLLLRRALGLGQGRAARVVHQDVEAPEPRHGGRDQVPDGLGPVEVAREDQDLPSGRGPDLARGLLEIVLRSAAHRHLRALLREHLGAGPAEALAGAADDRHLVPELEVHGAVLYHRGCGTLPARRAKPA